MIVQRDGDRDTLYRILRKETSSLQPGGGTYWETEVLYCGYDREEAMRVYWEHEPEEDSTGYGGHCLRIRAQEITDDQDSIEDATVRRVEA